MSNEQTTCPTCGAAVRVVGGERKGSTMHYEPVAGPVWTSEKPTEPGWYLISPGMPFWEGMTLTRVAMGRGSEHWGGKLAASGEGWVELVSEIKGRLWAGPIPQPQEQP
jgi:hypothetical protein